MCTLGRKMILECQGTQRDEESSEVYKWKKRLN